ncbi:phenylacetate--CoA ligase family protein [Polaribacter batillariae]|uniref:phenylacetate--CoA ligase family protein n=1 Tax=Polaribacter batillariae TaxID=2808900 RepID=UPI001FB07D6A|nr:phenylacetate--CoA ligase family protein [Polaribacter batillariae]
MANTSGTSGESLKFKRNEVADSFNRAASLRGYSWYGVKPWERNGYFWGVNVTLLERFKSKILDFLQNRFRIFTYKENEIKKFARKTLKATYIHGYSSMIYQTAILINKLNLPKPQNIKLVKGTSEKILDAYQPEIQQAFGKKIISEYGATESGIIAFECKFGAMHINMEGVLVEEVDNEILVTNLQMNSFPIIRYKLGDYIKLAPKNQKCSCGLQHRIILEVTGRIGENIYGKKEVYPSLYLYYIFKNLSKVYNIKLNYQVVQEEKGSLTFFIEQSLNNSSKQKLIDQIDQYFYKDIAFLINDNALFIKENKGKLKNFISKVKK